MFYHAGNRYDPPPEQVLYMMHIYPIGNIGTLTFEDIYDDLLWPIAIPGMSHHSVVQPFYSWFMEK